MISQSSSIKQWMLIQTTRNRNHFVHRVATYNRTDRVNSLCNQKGSSRLRNLKTLWTCKLTVMRKMEWDPKLQSQHLLNKTFQAQSTTSWQLGWKVSRASLQETLRSKAKAWTLLILHSTLTKCQILSSTARQTRFTPTRTNSRLIRRLLRQVLLTRTRTRWY